MMSLSERAYAVERRPRVDIRRSLLLTGGVAAAIVVGLVFAQLLGELSPGQARLLPLALIGGLALLVLALARPSALFVLAVALLAVVRVEPAPVDVAFALLILVTGFGLRRARAHLPPSVVVALLLFAPITILSLANASDWQRALRFEAITLYLLTLAAFLPSILARPTLVRRAAKAYIFMAAASAVVGALALEVGFPGSSVFVYQGSRVQALFKDPNVFGPFLVPPVVILLEELARPRLLGWTARRSAVMAALIAGGLLLSYSRAAMLNLGVAVATLIVVYAARRRGGKAAVRLVVGTGLCVAACITLLFATHSVSFFESRSHLQTYDQARFSTQDAGFKGATAHVFGFGPGQADINLSLAPHSVYARVAYEQGLAGLALLITLFLATLVVALRLAARDADLAGLGSAAMLACWVGVLANGFFIDTLHWRHLWLLAALIWTMAGLASAPREATND
jgi:O-Antigen ligase